MTCIIDAHQHFWTHGTYQTAWMERSPYAGDPAFAPIRRIEPSPVRAISGSRHHGRGYSK
jgi:hypothetical protein